MNIKINLLLYLFVMQISLIAESGEVNIEKKGLLWHADCEKSRDSKPVVQFIHTEYVVGKKGDAVLIEQRTKNLVKNPDLNTLSKWIEIGKPEVKTEGGAFSPSCVVVDSDNYIRQVLVGCMKDRLYCLSLYARSLSSEAKLDVLINDNTLGSFALNEKYTRIVIPFTTNHERSLLTLKGSSGKVMLDAVQIDGNQNYPTSFMKSGIRKKNRGVIPVDMIDPKCGSISLWFKPLWIDKINGGGCGLFGFGNPISSKRSYLAIRAHPNKNEPEHVWKNRLVMTVSGKSKNMKFRIGAVSPSIQKWNKQEWHHLVATWELNGENKKSNIQMFLDGKLASKREFSFPATIDLQNGDIGHWHGGYADAAIDEITLYKKILTKDEVVKLYEK